MARASPPRPTQLTKRHHSRHPGANQQGLQPSSLGHVEGMDTTRAGASIVHVWRPSLAGSGSASKQSPLTSQAPDTTRAQERGGLRVRPGNRHGVPYRAVYTSAINNSRRCEA